jgi:excinuclease ABC subunit C
VKIPTPICLSLDDAVDLANRINQLPHSAGVYTLDLAGRPSHVASCSDLPRRLKRLLVPSYTAHAQWLSSIRKKGEVVECWPTGSKLENALLTYELMKRHFPENYWERLRLRRPWFVELTADPFSYVRLVNRLSRSSGPLFGPFRTRDFAEAYAQQVQTLFQVRRCTEALSPHPDHAGCIYGEMNQCLRPCQCAVTADEYATEANRLAELLETNGKAVIAALSVARDRASEQMDFEQAAEIHKRIDRVESAAALRDPVIRAATRFSGLALTRGAGYRQFRLWPMIDGYWQEGVRLEFGLEEAPMKPLDQHIREIVAEAIQNPSVAGKRADHLAIFSRWYYSSWRDGQWFSFRTLSDVNYRKLVRDLSNMVKERSGIESPV